MDWYHRVDPEWLAARKNYLCASDILKLLPMTPTGQRRKNIVEAYRGVWADKHCRITENDVVSRGVMARGHILESYAVEELNAQCLTSHVLYHWDDTLVYRNNVSCSPDALDIRLYAGSKMMDGDDTPATFAAEIKSYAGPAHYQAAATPAMRLLERWQLVTAFYVMPSLVEAALVFYNPSAAHPLFLKYYERTDFIDDFEMVDLIRDEYLKQVADFETEYDLSCASGTCRPEEDIIAELEKLAADALNP